MKARDAMMVLLLDCWPVNIKKEFRDWVSAIYPFIRLRYIPAGMTCLKQINDVFVHAPYKKYMRTQAENWYQEEMGFLVTKSNTAVITREQFEAQSNRLLSLPNLRNLSVTWNRNALSTITSRNYGTENKPMNLIRKGIFTILKLFTILN